jgi:hypothetical protein
MFQNFMSGQGGGNKGLLGAITQGQQLSKMPPWLQQSALLGQTQGGGTDIRSGLGQFSLFDLMFNKGKGIKSFANDAIGAIGNRQGHDMLGYLGQQAGQVPQQQMGPQQPMFGKGMGMFS